MKIKKYKFNFIRIDYLKRRNVCNFSNSLHRVRVLNNSFVKAFQYNFRISKIIDIARSEILYNSYMIIHYNKIALFIFMEFRCGACNKLLLISNSCILVQTLRKMLCYWLIFTKKLLLKSIFIRTFLYICLKFKVYENIKIIILNVIYISKIVKV